MKLFLHALLSVIIFGACSPSSPENSEGSVDVWITTADKSRLLTKDSTRFTDQGQFSFPIINIDSTTRYQTIDGFGYSLTGGSAYLLNEKLDRTDRDKLLRELFSINGSNIGISYLRVSIGASDLDDDVFSYDDLPPGKTDKQLANFSIAADKKNLIPVLKEILSINREIKIMGSPWSAPVWMKSNGKAKGGSLKKEFYSTYADYFVKYINAMSSEGIPIDAVTLQNEPEHPGNTPSMTMTAAEQAEFVRDHLGPAFKKAGIKTKIIVYDHNCDHPEYPIAVLNDSSARKFIDGSAFHMYLGDISALSKVHEAHPDKNVYFTEQWTSGKGEFGGDLRWHIKNLIIGGTRNWSKTVLEWNLAADPEFNPHTDDGGCTLCLGALTIGDTVTRNVSYYIIAHASKFVRPGSVRIGSQNEQFLPNVAFITPDGKKVLIVLNDSDKEQHFGVRYKHLIAKSSLPAGAVATYVWP
jgi:glucosylceramidase